MKRAVDVISGVCNRCGEDTVVTRWFQNDANPEEPPRALCDRCLDLIVAVRDENLREPKAIKVFATPINLTVVLDDGRTLQMSLDEFPRLYNATPAQRQKHEFIGDGAGIRWPDIDEDLSVAGFLKLFPDSRPASLQARLDFANKRIAELEAKIEKRENEDYRAIHGRDP